MSVLSTVTVTLLYTVKAYRPGGTPPALTHRYLSYCVWDCRVIIQGAGTFTGAGLEVFRNNVMRASQGFRPDVKTVIIVLTGGDTEDISLAQSESNAIMATGVSTPM